MKIIDRYLISHFLRPMAACTAIFVLLVFVGHFFDKMSVFNDFHPRFGDMMAYLLLGVPYWLNVIFPVVTLLALMFSLGPLQQRGEIAAMQSAGLSSWRLYAPFLTLGLVISAVSMAGGLTFIPTINGQANEIYWRRIKKQENNQPRNHVVVAGRDHQRFTIGWLDPRAGTMKDVVINQFDSDGRPLRTIVAREARFVDNQWTFTAGNVIFLGAGESFRQEPFQTRVFDIKERPKDFIYEDRRPDDLSRRDLLRRIRHLSELGIPTVKEQVALQMQFALPLANVMVIVVGIPFALDRSRQGRTPTIAYACAATFFYWGAISIFQSYGEHGYLPPWVAAWAANFLFGLLAFVFLRRTSEF